MENTALRGVVVVVVVVWWSEQLSIDLEAPGSHPVTSRTFPDSSEQGTRRTNDGQTNAK